MNRDEMAMLLDRTIPEIQSRLRERDKVAPLSTYDMSFLLGTEQSKKNRVGIKEWLKVGIQSGKLPSEFYLTFNDKVGCLKSALQKFIRRSMTEKALRAARSLWRFGPEAATNRLRIIIPEDVHGAIGLLDYFSDHMKEAEFLAIVKAICEAPKDKSSCALAVEIDHDEFAKEKLVPNVALVQRNLMKRNELPTVTRHIFRMCKLDRYDEVYQILGAHKVVVELIERQRRGVRWSDDGVLLAIAAIRYVQQDYDQSIIPLPINAQEIKPLRLNEIDWPCFDFHTVIGRTVEKWLLARYRELDSKTLRYNWFMTISAKLEGKVIEGPFEQQPYDKEFLPKYGEELERLTKEAMNKFRLSEYDYE